MEPRDLGEVIALWNGCVERGEVVYVPLTEAYFQRKFLDNPGYSPAYSLVAEADGHVVGFINGIVKKVFLPKETHENTPGYITCFFVDPAFRRRGVGKALLDALCEAFARDGKSRVACSGSNPINLDWTVPGTPGHDHNNAPGMDEESMGHAFLLKNGFSDKYREVAMYLDLKDYRVPEDFEKRRQKLLDEGIYTGRYDVSLRYDFDEMCDRVGSEYWRKVLQDETAKENPRPILVATHGKHIVGFTGPVDKQESGRGWFSGICTDPLFEKRGIATVLFNLLMQEFIAEGALFSTLFTGDSNHAQRIYAQTGFRIARRFVVMDREI